MAEVKEEVATWRDLEARVLSSLELVSIAIQEGDVSLEGELSEEAREVSSRLEALELQLLLSGPYDSRNALFAIHAGAGGTESQDWAEMLLRMYLRWAERKGYEAKVVDLSPGEEAGLKSVTVEVKGNLAYGHLKSEKGVHRLVRLSPYDASHLRHTSFAQVEVLPEVQGDREVVISPDDLRIDVFRASGAGGQNVQKNSTAVRITHLATGIVVSCQNERSQRQNRDIALRVLQSRLMEIERQKRDAERAKLKGEYVEAGWGNQIRSYVLHPYKMVKDHRTDVETTNPEAVLDGDLDAFMAAFLRSQVGKEREA